MNNFFQHSMLLLISLLMLAACTAQNVIYADPSLHHLNTLLAKQQTSVKFSEAYVDAGGQRIHYVSGGRGKLLFFYHGFPGYWYVWKNQLRELAKHYRVVALDGLGTNLSDKPTELGPYTVDQLAMRLQLAIDRISAGQPYTLIGHDWGGALAWAYAQTNPPQLEKLIVLSAPPYNLFLELLSSNAQQQQASSYVGRLKSADSEQRLGENRAYGFWKAAGFASMVTNGFLSPKEGELFRTALAREGAVTGGLNWYRSNIPAFDLIEEKHFWPSRNASTDVASMLIWGQNDKTFVPEFLQKMPSYASNLRIEVLPGIGHTPHLRAANDVNQLIREFVESP